MQSILYLVVYYSCDLMNNEEHVYIKIEDYIFILDDDTCGAEEQSQSVRTHEGIVGSRKSQWTTDFSQNSGTFIVYNFHVTCSNSSFSLVMVTPTFHFFVFHWLQFTSMCCLFPIGYLPKPINCVLSGSHFYGWTYLSPFAKFNHVHRSRWYSDYHFVDIIFGWMKPSTTSADTTTPAGYGDIPVITPILSMYLSTTSAVFHTCRSR